jgi:hypothetical protein
MDLDAKIILGVAGFFVVALGVIDWRIHKKADDVHDSVKGVRIRLERHADEMQYEAEKDRAENRRLRTSIYRQFKEWLAHMRAP